MEKKKPMLKERVSFGRAYVQTGVPSPNGRLREKLHPGAILVS
jgi:hypothetical protein